MAYKLERCTSLNPNFPMLVQFPPKVLCSLPASTMKAFAPSRTRSCREVPSSLIALDFLCPSRVHFWAPGNKQVSM